MQNPAHAYALKGILGHCKTRFMSTVDAAAVIELACARHIRAVGPTHGPLAKRKGQTALEASVRQTFLRSLLLNLCSLKQNEATALDRVAGGTTSAA